MKRCLDIKIALPSDEFLATSIGIFAQDCPCASRDVRKIENSCLPDLIAVWTAKSIARCVRIPSSASAFTTSGLHASPNIKPGLCGTSAQPLLIFGRSRGRLGLLYYNGYGVARDYMKAREWYEKRLTRATRTPNYT
jgi:TPR repeat protein